MFFFYISFQGIPLQEPAVAPNVSDVPVHIRVGSAQNPRPDGPSTSQATTTNSTNQNTTGIQSTIQENSLMFDP